MSKVITTTFQLRRGNSSWYVENDPILAQGEPVYELDTKKLKIGDGVHNYSAIPYLTDKTQAIIAPLFDEYEFYSVGDYVIKDDTLYQFIHDHQAEPWDEDDVVEDEIWAALRRLESTINTKYTKPTNGIPTNDIANNAITNAKIQNGAITAVKIQNNTVTISNLTNDLRNKIYNIPKYITVYQNIPYSQLDTFLSIPIGKYASSMYITSGSSPIYRWKEFLGSFSEPLIPVKLNNEIKFFPLFQIGSEISCEDCGEGYYYNGIDILTYVSSAGATTYSPLYAYFPYDSDRTHQVSDHDDFDTSCIYSAERPSCNDSCEDCGDCDWPGCEDCGEGCADCGESYCADCGESYCADCGEGSSSRTITVEGTSLEIPEGYSTWGSILNTNIIPKYNNNPCIVKGSSIGTKSFFSNYLYYSTNGSSNWEMLARVEENDEDNPVLSYVKYTDSFDFNPSHHYESRYYHACEDDGSMWGCEDCGEI